MADLIGQRLGQYEIIASIGAGGMATVYRARQLNIRREVAIKVIKSDLAASADFIRRFEREAETIAGLSHPHILKLFEYGEQGGVLYLVMELLSGGSLSELITRERPLPLDKITRIIEQIASALDYAHQEGIIHRDLKPQNVLFDKAGNAFLSDFGIAKLLTGETSLTQTGMAMGTPSYMSPEQWRGSIIDSRTDLYAFGIMVFEMLTGRLPYVSDTPFSMMHKHVYDPPPSALTLRPDLPAEIDMVIANALAKEPEQRYQTAGAVVTAVKAALQGLSIPVRSAAVPDAQSQTLPYSIKAAPPSKRNRTGLVLGGLVLLVLLALGIIVIPKLGSGASNTPTITTVAVVATAQMPTVSLNVDTQVAATFAARYQTATQQALLLQPPTNTTVAPTATATPTIGPNFDTLVAATIAARDKTATQQAILLPSPTNTALPPTATFSNTPITPTNTSTNTLTNTPILPVNTLILIPTSVATSTPLPPTATFTDTSIPPTNTLIVPTLAATTTPLPPVTPTVAHTPLAALGTVPITAANATQVRELAHLNKDVIHRIQLSPDGKTLALVDGSLHIWFYNTAQLSADPRLVDASSHVVSIAFSPDGSLLASGGDQADKTVRLWDVHNGQLKTTLSGHTDSVQTVAFSPDGSLLASGSDDNTVRLWDLHSGQLKTTLSGHKDWVSSVTFSLDGLLLASGSADGTVRLWDVHSSQLKTSFSGRDTSVVESVAFSPDATLLAAGNGTISVWVVATGQLKETLAGNTTIGKSIAFSTDGTLLATDSYFDGAVLLWDVRSTQLRATLPGQKSAIGNVAFSADGTLLASANADGTARLWAIQPGPLPTRIVIPTRTPTRTNTPTNTMTTTRTTTQIKTPTRTPTFGKTLTATRFIITVFPLNTLSNSNTQ